MLSEVTTDVINRDKEFSVFAILENDISWDDMTDHAKPEHYVDCKAEEYPTEIEIPMIEITDEEVLETNDSPLESEIERYINEQFQSYLSLNRFDDDFITGVKEEEHLLRSFGLPLGFGLTRDILKFAEIGLNFNLKRNLRVKQLSHWDPITELIRDYFRKSFVHEHNINLNIVQIWQVFNSEHNERFVRKGYDQMDNWLLWHGTKRDNLVSILDHNLRLPDHPGMFGKGIYFADRVTKSAQYTDGKGAEVLLLYRVALGKCFQTTQRTSIYKPPINYDSIHAVGRSVPDEFGERRLGPIRVPCGLTVDNDCKDSQSVYNNEFVVFDPDRVQIMFVLNCVRTLL